MKSYGIEMMGGLVVRHYAGGMPAWGAADEGAWAWDDDGNKMYYGTDSAWVEVGSGSGGSDVGRMLNVGLAATVGSKALTVALKGENGSDPSASNPVTIAFRDETLTTGTPNVRTITSALDIVLASGGTLGFTAAEAGRIYVWALDNAGTVMLGLSRTADIFPESNLVADPVDIGSGSDLANTMYVTSHVHNVACRCLGYIEITTGATAGEWDNAPTKIQIMGPGVKRTGDVVQKSLTVVGTLVSGSTTTPNDNTIPQITEGDEYIAAPSFTATSNLNSLVIECQAQVSTNAALHTTGALHRVGSSDALSTMCVSVVANTYFSELRILYSAVFTSATNSFTFRIGGNGGGIVYMNGTSVEAKYNGTVTSYLSITEVFA
jgi:hypothetical protein